MGWREAPPVASAPLFEGFETPESAPVDQMHYLMQSWHVLQLARMAAVESVRQAVLKLQEEEREHVELVKAWMLKVPQPDAHWDPDPPRYDD